MGFGRIPRSLKVSAVAGAFALALVSGIGVARADSDQPVVNPAHTGDTAQPVIYQPAQSIADTYQLGAGDKLRIAVYGEDDLGGTFDVDGNGFISLPLIGQVKVAGMSAPQVERTITAKLSDGYLKEPRVNVEVALYRPFYVLGQVNRPGAYPYVDGMTIQNAVATAGGYTEKAVEGSYYVRHLGDAEETSVDADGMTRIYPGDVIRIKSSPFWDALSIIGPITGLSSLAYTFRN